MKSRHYKSDSDELVTILEQIKQEDEQILPSAELQAKLKTSFQAKHRRFEPAKFRYQIAAVFLISLFAGSFWILTTRELRQNRTETDTLNMEPGDYLPLTYGFTPEESLQRVRVKLPRSALNQFGITLKQTPDNDVTADVLVGESGVAYAIRVVQ